MGGNSGKGTGTLQILDACGGHFGVTPDSKGEVVYHYHVQDNPPFVLGCFGPAKAETGPHSYRLVTLAECRALYSDCGDGDTMNVTTPTGSMQYDPWCPCYDGAHSNVLGQELEAFSSNSTVVRSCSGASCSSFGADSINAERSSDSEPSSRARQSSRTPPLILVAMF